MKFKLLSLKALPLAVLLCMASAAQADVLVFTDRTAFLAAISLPGTDTFDDLSGTRMDSPLTRTAGTYGYRASSGPVSDFYPAGSAADRWLATTFSTDSITFSNFSTGVRAFGGNFFGTDADGLFDPGRTMVLTATDGSTTRTVNLYNTTTSTFLGFISTNPLSSVVLRPEGLPGVGYWATTNNVTLGMVPQIPEPASYGMLIAGLGLVGFMARRRAR